MQQGRRKWNSLPASTLSTAQHFWLLICKLPENPQPILSNPFFSTTEIISLGSSDVECCFVWRATSHPAPQIYGWSPQRAPYRHSLLLKFLHISSFTYCMMILYPSPIFCPFLICNKICIKNKTSAATPKNCCVRIYFVFFLFWKGQGLCCYFSSLVTLLDPAHKDIYANCAPLGSRPSMRI